MALYFFRQSCWGLDWAKWLELTTNTVSQCVQQQNSSIHATINDSQEFTGFCSHKINKNRKTNLQEYSWLGMGEVQMYRMSRSHNDDVMNVNGQLPDD